MVPSLSSSLARLCAQGGPDTGAIKVIVLVELKGISQLTQKGKELGKADLSPRLMIKAGKHSSNITLLFYG